MVPFGLPLWLAMKLAIMEGVAGRGLGLYVLRETCRVPNRIVSHIEATNDTVWDREYLTTIVQCMPIERGRKHACMLPDRPETVAQGVWEAPLRKSTQAAQTGNWNEPRSQPSCWSGRFPFRSRIRSPARIGRALTAAL